MLNNKFGHCWMALFRKLKALTGTIRRSPDTKKGWPPSTYNLDAINLYFEEGLKRLDHTNASLSTLVREAYLNADCTKRNGFDMHRQIARDNRFSVPERIEILTAFGKPDRQNTEEQADA